jgi:hypothetical protein
LQENVTKYIDDLQKEQIEKETKQKELEQEENKEP